MPKVRKWVCNLDDTHIFDEYDDGFCSIHPYPEAYVVEKWIDDLPTVVNPVIEPPVVPVPDETAPEVGLCVLLMDASSSMTEPAFEGSPTRMRLIAGHAASGIFELERMKNNPNAFVAAYKFDHRVELMFVDTVANLLEKFQNDVRKFGNYLYDELYAMQGGTDINQALKDAYGFVDKFMKKQLNEINQRRYRPMTQRIMKFQTAQAVTIPNVRVLVYTDGMQFDSAKNKILKPNPFKQNPLAGLNHDVVIGAYFGKQNEEGSVQLKSILSNCPLHDVPQFFLIDDHTKVGVLKHLFRMASGASGFCPKCLQLGLTR